MEVMYVLFVLLAVLATVFLAKSRDKVSKGVPGPTGLPLIGYIPFLGKHPSRSLSQLCKKYGPVFSVSIGTEKWVILNDYESISEAFVANGSDFSGRPYLYMLHTVYSGGGFGITSKDYSDDFKAQKKFSLTTLRGLGFGKRSMEGCITEEILHLIELISSEAGKPYDCKVDVMKSVENVICSVTMGSRFSYDDETFRKITGYISRWFADKRDAFLLAVLTYCGSLRHFPPFSGACKRLVNDLEYLFEYIAAVLEEHKQNLDDNNPKDFIDECLKMMKRPEFRESFHDRQLFHTILDLFVGGGETTTITVRWCILSLARDPELQEKLWVELNEVIGSATPSIQHKEKMPLVNSFLHEVARHFTVFPLGVPHVTAKDVTFRGYFIPKQTPVLSNLWGALHDEEYFENPREFRPERFMNSEGAFVPDKHVISFGLGPRRCLGEQLAKMEVLLYVTNIIQRFHIKADPDHPLPASDDGLPGFMEGPPDFKVLYLQR